MKATHLVMALNLMAVLCFFFANFVRAQGVPLADAVDAPLLTWTTGGNQVWVGQANTTFDGVDAAQSGAITHSQESWLQTTVTGPGHLRFRWKVSLEANYDYLEFYLDGVLQEGSICGEVEAMTNAQNQES